MSTIKRYVPWSVYENKPVECNFVEHKAGGVVFTKDVKKLEKRVRLLEEVVDAYREQIEVMGCQACGLDTCTACQALAKYDKWVKRCSER